MKFENDPARTHTGRRRSERDYRAAPGRKPKRQMAAATANSKEFDASPSERSKVQGANESLSSARSAAHRSPPCRFFTGRFPAIQDTGVRDFVVGVFQRENWTVGGPSDEIVGYQPHDLVDSGPPMHTGSDVLCLHERIAAPATLRIPDAWIRPVIAEHPQILGRSPIQEHLPAFERGLRIGIEAEMP